MKTIFKTTNNNHYLYQSRENKVLFLHPLIHFFSGMEDRGLSAGEWIDKLDHPDNNEGSSISIKDLGVFTIKEIRYYFKKYNLLKEKNVFSHIKDKPPLQRRLTPQDIENLVTRCKEVIFEVTKTCNLDCRYCIQGDLYQIHEKDQRTNIHRDKAKRLLDYLHRYWSRSLAPEHIGIKFYGGEPLTNFEAIKEIVEYTKTLTGIDEKFYYYITTNGVLLDKHLDYLVANNFYISISLDGDQNNNSHRIYHNGKPSFEKITANINHIRENHPSYFEKNVSFQSVLHNRNSIADIHNYFEKSYQKRPFMTQMTRVGVNQARKSEFDNIKADTYHNLYHGEDYPLLKEKKLNELPKTPGSGIITHHIYNWLLKDHHEPGERNRNKTPTGTCHPFSKGLFLSTDGKILPCERIEHKFSLGHINDEVELDFKAISERFNGFYDNMNRLCLSCANASSCNKCMFYCKVEEPHPVCDHFSSQKDFLQKLSDNIEYLEDKPGIYVKHITELKEEGKGGKGDRQS
ncbi:MAG: radical SAM peptide maturase [bacterium]|nr:radical SAM peptide maturase [bacterium]